MQPVARVSIDQFPPGHVFARRFTVQRLLGAGGMGAVYEVQDQKFLGSPRALKILRPEIALDRDIQTRFVAEAQVARALSNDTDHVVRVDEYDQDPDTGCLYLLMELLQGETIGALVARSGPMGWQWLTYFGAQLYEAIGLAHRTGVVHRDIKPDNIFVAQLKGRPTIKVLDFGIAKRVDPGHRRTTRSLGTPDWAAPEQASNRPVTPATDVWALGLVVFYLATGRVYWQSATDTQDADLAEVLQGAQEPASERARRFAPGVVLPAGFDAWFARSVHSRQDQRFANATEAFQALQALPPPSAQPSQPAWGGGTVPAGWSSGSLATAPTSLGPTSLAPVSPAVVPSFQPTPTSLQHPNPPFQPTPTSLQQPTPTSLGQPLQGGTQIGTQIGPMPSDAGTGPMGGASSESLRRPPASRGGGLGLVAVLAVVGLGVVGLGGTLWMRHQLSQQRADCLSSGSREACETACRQFGQRSRWMTGDAAACARLGELQDDTSKQTADRLASSGVEAIAVHDVGPLETACKNGLWKSCTLLGQWYAEGRAGKAVIASDGAKAQKVLQGACTQGEPLACRELGLLLRQGNGVRRDDGAAAAVLASGCKEGEASLSCAALADLQRIGQPLDLARAVALDHKGCEGGEPTACRDEGRALERSGDRGKAQAAYEKARTLFRKGCEEGQAAGCLALGDLLEQGLGGGADASSALEMRRRGCAAGLPAACTLAGHDSASAGAHGVAILDAACRAGDPEGCLAAGQEARALAIWDARCELDGADACARLGMSRGGAVSASKREAALRKACQLGHGASCHAVGVSLLAAGDVAHANEMFALACDRQDASGCREVGQSHCLGRGMSRDASKGQEVLRRACDWGDKEACASVATCRPDAPVATSGPGPRVPVPPPTASAKATAAAKTATPPTPPTPPVDRCRAMCCPSGTSAMMCQSCLEANGCH